MSFLQTPSATHQSTSSSRGEPLHTCGAWLFTSGELVFTAATQRMPLYHPALETEELTSWVHGTITIGNSVLGRLLLPGYCTDNRLKHTPILSQKETKLLVQDLLPESRFPVWSTGWDLLTLSENGGQWMQSLCYLSASLQLASIFQKGSYTHF